MLRGALESAAIVSGIRDDEPPEDFSTHAIPSVKLVVLPADAERALETVWSAAILPGEGEGVPVEFTQKVAGRPAAKETPRCVLPASSTVAWARWVAIAALVLASVVASYLRSALSGQQSGQERPFAPPENVARSHSSLSTAAPSPRT